MNKLNVFVSSTCFDLSQIRVDLHEFISNCGYNPVLSEYKNFPINPSKKTVDNCIDAVKNSADVFVLVVGSRYGSEIETGRSITNTEFLTAKNRGIPVYIFIERRILSILSVWKNNRSGDFSEFVDTTKIFEFIAEVRDDSKLWTFEFDSAQDIISVLKTQLSYLFKESLQLKHKLFLESDDLLNLNISNKALSLVLEKPEHYETLFFFQTMVDEIVKKESLRNDFKYAIILNSKFAVYDNLDLLNWVQQRIDVLHNLINSLNNLIHKAFPIYYAEPGTSSDLKGLFYTSETYARIYESILNWTIETAGTYVDEDGRLLRDKLAKLADNVINDIWDFPFETLNKINKTIIEEDDESAPSSISLILTIDIDQQALNDYNIEFEKFQRIVLG